MSAVIPGLEMLATAVIVLDHRLRVKYANPAAENLFELSSKNIVDHAMDQVFQDPGRLLGAIHQALAENASVIEHELTLSTAGHAPFHLSCMVTPVEIRGGRIVVEFQHIDQQLKIAKEERILDQGAANRALIRNLAHEIKNPLGGIRGAAQLLGRELGQPGLKEYTQVIMQEADRLQSLMDRLLTPHRLPQLAEVNIHEVLERVRSLVLAEFPDGIVVRRDYDTSLPNATGDKEQLIQAVLNIARNAAQAMEGRGAITLKTRAARQATLAKKRYRLALMVQIIDTGPGIPEAIRDKIFLPLISGRDGGHGLGLTLAQTFVAQHHGTIEWESTPGRTCFTLMLPLQNKDEGTGPVLSQSKQ